MHAYPAVPPQVPSGLALSPVELGEEQLFVDVMLADLLVDIEDVIIFVGAKDVDEVYHAFEEVGEDKISFVGFVDELEVAFNVSTEEVRNGFEGVDEIHEINDSVFVVRSGWDDSLATRTTVILGNWVGMRRLGSCF